jgi:hypothetical protein
MMRSACFPSQLPYGAESSLLEDEPLSLPFTHFKRGQFPPGMAILIKRRNIWAFFVRCGAGFLSVRLHCIHNAFMIFSPGSSGVAIPSWAKTNMPAIRNSDAKRNRKSCLPKSRHKLCISAIFPSSLL